MRVITVLLVLLVLTIILLSIPIVQTKVANRVTAIVNDTYDVNINIDRLGLNWKGEFDARNVYIEDHKGDTLIYANEVQTNILSIKNLFKDDFDFGNVRLTQALLNYKTHKGDKRDNLYVFSQKFKPKKPIPNSVFTLTADNVILKNSEVRIINENNDTPEILMLRDVDLDTDDLKVINVDVFTHIQSLSLKAKRGFQIEDLSGNFAYTENEMMLENMHIITEDSAIKGDLLFSYGENGMSDFFNEVAITAHFDKTKIATNDLNSFYNAFGENQIITLSGELKGNLNDFKFTKAAVSYGDTFLLGDYVLQNILNDKDYTIQANNHLINTNYYDLRRLMPRLIGDQLPKQIKTLGAFTFSGNTTISTKQLITKSKLFSDIGTATTDLIMDDIHDTNHTKYKGSIQLENFNVGAIANVTALGGITSNVTINGTGFTQNTVNTEIEGMINSFTIQGYDYKNIQVAGNLKNPLFNGDLVIDDPNLKMNFKGLVDVSENFNQYDFIADVEFAELNKLNLFKRDSVSVFAGRIIADMDGTTLDNARGFLEFQQTFYQNEVDDYYFDDFKVTSSFKKEIRTIEINSPDIIDGKISGKFILKDIPNLFQNGIASIYANYIPQEVTTNQYIDYEFTVDNKIVEIFVPFLEFGQNTKVKGSVSSDESKFVLNFKSPELLVAKNYFGSVNIQVDNNNPLYNTYVSIDSIFTGAYNFSKIDLINKTINDTLYLQTEFKGGNKKQDKFDLALYHTINPSGKSVVGFSKSKIYYNGNDWYFNEVNDKKNKVVFDDNFQTIQIDTMVLNHNEERIELSGIVKGSNYKDVKLRFKDVNVGNLVPKIDSLSLAGNINGKLDFLQKKGGYYPNSNLIIDDVVINETPFGDLSLIIRGNSDLSKYAVNTTLINENVKSISALGTIDVVGTPTIDVDVVLDKFDLKAFSPFGGDVITDIRGLASGNVNVNGKYTSPNTSGTIQLKNSGLKIPYLNTDFDLENNTILNISKNTLAISETKIVDTKYNTNGKFSGAALHTNFSEWELDLKIDATDKLLVLDTPPAEDALYYGTAFISGIANIEGPTEELIINVEATTEKGTSFKIPISDIESIGDDSFVKFLSPEEKQARVSGETFITEELKGLSLNFELDINDNAEVEVVVDQANDSRLKGRGNGILLLEINTLGKFNMWGDFLITEGKYDFNYGGIINKKIDVVQGGSITWDGDPLKARLNLSAKYRANANPAPILDNSSVNRKIPVDVIVDLSGEITQPDLDFRIEFPKASSVVRSELEYKLNNEEERLRQALFLVASNSFVGNGTGAGGLPGTIGAEFVSSLVGDLLADQDAKFIVLPNYQPGENTPLGQSADRLGVAIQTQITDRLLINGTVGVPVGGVNETRVAGDVEVQWLINEDGSLRMNFFNRQADIQFIGEDQIFEQGLGASYSVDFDKFSELVFKLFNKKLSLEKEREEETPVVPDDNDFPPVDSSNDKGVKPDEE